MADDLLPSWYVVYTQPSAERRAAEHRARQGFATDMPQCLKKRRHARGIDSVAAPFFTRYLFVGIDIARERWRSINSTIGVGSGDEPKPVMPRVDVADCACEDPGGFISLEWPTARPTPGATIRIMKSVPIGPWSVRGALRP